jgi:hypothetical protein
VLVMMAVNWCWKGDAGGLRGRGNLLSMLEVVVGGRRKRLDSKEEEEEVYIGILEGSGAWKLENHVEPGSEIRCLPTCVRGQSRRRIRGKGRWDTKEKIVWKSGGESKAVESEESYRAE